MQSAITTDRAAPAEIHPQLIFTLEWWDHLAWWMCRWDRARDRGERGGGARLLFWMAALPLGALAAVGIPAAMPGEKFTGLGRLVLLMAVAAGFAALGWLASRRGFPGDLLENALRENYEGRMRDRAGEMELEGQEINRHRIHWFAVTADGFTELTEVRGVALQGVEYYEHRETGGSWKLIQDVVVTPAHLFLVRAGEEAWIIPTRCLAHQAATARFVELVQECRKACSHAPVGVIAAEPRTAHAIQAQPPAAESADIPIGDEPCSPTSSPASS
jgi:hypothetical protein